MLVHGGGAKGKGLLDKLRKLPAVSEVKLEAPKYERDYAQWVHTEFRDLGARIDQEAATLLVASVGQDLRALAGAADQLDLDASTVAPRSPQASCAATSVVEPTYAATRSPMPRSTDASTSRSSRPAGPRRPRSHPC